MQEEYYETCFNIYGEAFYVKTIRTNPKYKQVLYYGHSIEHKGHKGKAKLILTPELKAFLGKHKNIHASQFGEHLSTNTIKNLRRELKRNPYKNYDAWHKSKDKNKPKEIRFLDRKEHPEFLRDYFGNVYVLASASTAQCGIALPKGTLKEVFFSSNPEQTGVNNKEYIVTKELVECIRKHKHNIQAAADALVSTGDMKHVIRNLRKKLGYDKTVLEEIDTWVAGHLEEIFSMSCETFLQQYAQDVDIGKGAVVVNFKTYANQLVKCVKSRRQEDKVTLAIVRTLKEDVAVEEVRKRLKKHLPKSRGELIKAYNILMLAREHKQPVPKDLLKVLKNERF